MVIKQKFLILSLALIGALASCKESAAPRAPSSSAKQPVSDSDAVLSSSNCSSSRACSRADMRLTVEGLEAGILQGYVQEEINWVFSAKDLNDSTRRVVLLFDKQPAGVTLDPPLAAGSLASTVRMNWLPPGLVSNLDRGLEVHMRDLDRCENTESDPSVCQSLRPLPDYDQVESYKWQIVSRNSNTSLTTSTSTGTDCAGASGNGLQGVMNGIQGIKSLSGGDMSGIGGITDMIGSLINMGGKLMGNNSGC